MKRVLIAACVIALSFSMAGVVGATTYTYDFQPSPRPDLWDLDHYKFYTWGIDWSVPDGETIVGASLFFDNIRNYNWTSNDLWVHLLDSAPDGVTVGRDNQGGGDYFDGQGILLNHWQDLPATPQDITYNFSASEIAGLSSYLTDGNIGLGFDPDCHFYNSGITLTIKTSVVPIPAAAWLMLAGLAGIIGVRKRVGN